MTVAGPKQPPAERFLVTGALGCLGAWVVAQLTREGVSVVALDAAADPYRVRYLLDDEQLAAVEFVRHDILDVGFCTRLCADRGITSIVHLAALQVPFARADPFLAAQVNVAGTVSLFEAARAAGTVTAPLVYASSIAAYGAPDVDHPETAAGADPTGFPRTHYGVYKRANEDGARVHWLEFGVPSIGLRPHTLYGVGRDQGMTSAPTKAMLAAALGRREEIPFSGSLQLHYARDAAWQFIAATRSEYRGAAVFNLGGPATAVSEVVDAIEQVVPEAAGHITVSGGPLPFPGAVDAGGLETVIGAPPVTSIDAGVAETIDRFRRLHESGRLVTT
jgi:UDP-glucuronate 4-epimerase